MNNVQPASDISTFTMLTLMLAVFTVSVGFGVVLPHLPYLIERLLGAGVQLEQISRHTGLLTAVYTLSLFLFVSMWTWLSNQSGLVIATVSLLLVSCTSLAPPYVVPVMPVEPRYALYATQEGVRVTTIGWRDYFTDPRLQSLIVQALANNRDLRTALLRVDEARAIYGIQRAEQFPALDVQAGVSRLRVPADLNLARQSQVISLYQVAVGMVGWEIDFWGRVRSLKDAALDSYLATDAASRAAVIELIAQVANSYLTLCELDERISLARQTIASRTETLRIFSRRFALGATSRLNLTQVEALLIQSQILGAQLEQSRETQAHVLTLLVGASVDLPPLPGRLGAQDMLVELRPGLPSDLLVQRPDIAAAEYQLKASNANIGAARAAFFPRVALTSLLGTASAELDGLFASGSHAWIFSPSISLPIFDGGRRRNNLSLAEVRRNLAVANYEKTVQSAFRDVSDALSARRWIAEQTVLAEAALKTQAERARLSQLRYDNGASTFLEVLDAQRELLSAEQQLVLTRRALLSSHISLYKALGGGSLEFVPISPEGLNTP
jgi:multidrug efflux system outer membrane protein